MGVLRFVPELKEIAGARFGRIPYFHDGFLRGLDNKSRLHVDRRVEISRARGQDTDVPLRIHGFTCAWNLQTYGRKLWA